MTQGKPVRSYAAPALRTKVFYTGEDLKWDTPSGCHFKSLPISRQAIQHPSDAYGPYCSLGELKCPILILKWCKQHASLPPFCMAEYGIIRL